MNPINHTERERVAELQAQLDALRDRLKISERGKVLYLSGLESDDDKVVTVEADGFGGAVLRIIEGNYPIDYFVREERVFLTETDAESAAEALT